MKLLNRLIVAPICLILAACGINPNEQTTVAEIAQGDQDPGKSLSFRSKALDPAIHSAVHPLLKKLGLASDIEFFCPGYARATATQQESCWVTLVKAVAFYESGLNPRATFKEPNGIYSVGLLMLSPGECPKALTMNELKNARANLNCGVDKMASLISKDGLISGAEGHRGASQYWSVLREPYTYKQYKLGKKMPIAKLTRQYLRASL